MRCARSTACDRLGSADRTFTVLGTGSGLTRDFGHVDVLRGKRAEAEVLPAIDVWMRDHLTTHS